MTDVSIVLAFSAGLLSFLSPCILPMVPAYVGYLTGSAAASIGQGYDKKLLLIKSLGFILGFSLVFVAMGATASALGKLLSGNIGVFRKIGGAVVVLFGLHMTGIFRIKALYREKRLLPFGEAAKRVVPVFVGMAFAAGWTPCVGPVLSSILIYAGSGATVAKGVALLAVYSLGLAVPFLAAAFTIDYFSAWLRKIARFLPAISVACGILLIVMGVLIFTGRFNILSGTLSFSR